MEEIAPGLRRWTSWHDHWEEDVGSVAVETDDGLVLIDPNATPKVLRRPAHVLLTVYWHARGTTELAGKPRVWSPSRSAQPLRNRGIDVTNIVGQDEELPGGIQAFPTARAAEVVYWLPQQRTVVVGDVLLGAGAKPRDTGELRLCPERWLGKPTHDDLRTSLQPLLDLPVVRVLPGHGRPVLRNGKRELERLLSS